MIILFIDLTRGSFPVSERSMDGGLAGIMAWRGQLVAMQACMHARARNAIIMRIHHVFSRVHPSCSCMDRPVDDGILLLPPLLLLSIRFPSAPCLVPQFSLKFYYVKRRFPVTSKCRQMHGVLNVDEIKN
jgi:hypothetical protein